MTSTLPQDQQFPATASALRILSGSGARGMTDDVVCLLDAAGVVYHASESAALLTGRSSSHLVGRPITGWLSSNSDGPLMEFVSSAIQKTAGSHRKEVLLQTDDGPVPAILVAEGPVPGTRPLLGVFRLRSGGPATHGSASSAGFVQAVEGVEQSLQELLGNLKGVVFRLDATGRFQFANRAWEEFSGFQAAESIDKSFLEFIDHDDAKVFVESFEELLMGETATMRQDLRLMRATGGVTWCEFHACAPQTGASGGGRAVYGLLTDITARKLFREEREHYIGELQQARAQAEKQAASLSHLAQQLMGARDEAMKAIEAKTQFLANMSHEIRTPMNGIVGMLGLLLESELQKDQREYADIARNSGVALMEILSEILDYSKIESRTLELEVERFSLHQLLDDLVESYAERAESNNIEIFCQVDNEVPKDVVGDLQRLRQVLNHLLNNALKFTSDGEVRLFVAAMETSGNRVQLHFEVSDTGVGVPADRQPHIFKPFYQVDESNSRKFGGTGLGLAICQELVSLMGGQIGVSSEPGEGATFWFTADLGVPPMDEVSEDLSKLSGRSIFVYATTPSLRTALQQQMGSWGMQVQTPADPSEAMRALLRKPSNGPAVRVLVAEAEALAAAPGGTVAAMNRLTANVEIRLILVTPFQRSAYRAVLKDLMVSDLLTKPLRSPRLRDAVLKAIREFNPNLPLEESIEAAQLTHAPREPEIDARGRILISQTDWVHQRLTTYLLSSLGYRGEIASTEDYCESLMLSRRYSLLLLDVENPRFDAISFVRRLRKQESGKLHRTSVVALVKNLNDRIEATMRDAGVDEFLVLPLQATELKDVLSRLCVPEPEDSGPLAKPKRNGSSPAEEAGAEASVADAGENPAADANAVAEDLKTPATPRISRQPALDPSVIASFERLTAGSDVDIYGHMVWPALDDVVIRLQSIREALEVDDITTVYHEAHTIKGSCGYIGATLLQEVSHLLEKSAKEKTLVREEADAQVLQLQQEHQRIVAKLIEEGHSPPAAEAE